MVNAADGGGGGPYDSWVPTTTAPISIDVSSLLDYIKLLTDHLEKDFTHNQQVGIQPMLQVPAPFGGGGLAEGQYFRQMHDRGREAVGLMLADVGASIASVIAATTDVYYAYISGDALGAATVDDVMNAFYPGPGMKSLRGSDEDPATPAATNSSSAPPEEIYRHHDSLPGDASPLDPDGAVWIGKPNENGSYLIPADSDQPHNEPDPTS